jgi:DnaJ-class molecular chaperone
MRTIDTCPLCRGRGTNRRAAGRYRPDRTNLRDRCVACRGAGGIDLRRLQQLVRRGTEVVIRRGAR